MDWKDIVVEYRNRVGLVPQDIVKCYLKVYQRKNGVTFYDHRVKLWWIRPGDVVFINGSFYPVVSFPRIDDTLKGIKCGHMEEMQENRKRIVRCLCRKWYLYYKLDNGKMRRFHPPWDGLTCIPAEEIKGILKELKEGSVDKHFTKGMLLKEDIMSVLTEINTRLEKNL